VKKVDCQQLANCSASQSHRHGLSQHTRGQYNKSASVNVMKTIEILETSDGQSVPLPEEFRFETHTVSIRRQGEAVILEPIKPTRWPEQFFETIRIEDPTFERPNQGVTPPAPSFK